MTTIQLHLTDPLKAYIDQRVADSGFVTAEEYLRGLIEADRERQSGRNIEERLLAAIDGPFSEWTDSDIDQIRDSTWKRCC